MRDILQRYPFLLLLVALAGGIVCGDACYFAHRASVLPDAPVTLFCSGFLLLLAAHRYARTIRFRPLFTLATALFCWMLGTMLCEQKLHRADPPASSGNAVYRVTLVAQPEQKARSVMCRAEEATTRKLLLLYLSPDSAAHALMRGDRLWIHARLEPPHNFDKFDYARYLARKGVSATAFVASDCWQKAGHDSTRTLSQRARDYRAQIVNYYRRLGFGGDNLGVLSALTVGEKEELGEEIRNTYTVAGVSHVLALSGLHVGILYMLCIALLGKKRKVRIVGTLLIVLPVMWLFALLTGLSASVVRSVILFSLLALSQLSFDRPYTINILAAIAFLMLLCCPLWLFDVGFQLSFIAVASIHFIQPRLHRLLPLPADNQLAGRLLRYPAGLLTVSTAAQIGTAPLVLFYFHRFPTYFLLTNLWMIPLVTLCLCTAIVMLLLSPFLTPLQQGAVWLLDTLLNLQNHSLRWIEQLPWASITGQQIDTADMILYYLFLAALLRCIDVGTARNVYIALFTLLALTIRSFVLRFFIL
ncbi:MAG: ComEC family competence protein [Prevotellaceae bacterium]|nr:ComEC family competence protein [Prevotellaceae bacterium]